MVDIALKSGASWVCPAGGHQLADCLLPVHMGTRDDEDDDDDDEEEEEEEPDQKNQWSPVLLEQVEDGSPCVLTVRCRPSAAAIGHLLVVSEARTMELYDETGEYCGTARGERDDGVRPDTGDRGPFYRKQLVLDQPSSACQVKLLSLAGRTSVLVGRVVVGLRPAAPGPVRGPGVDMRQVRILVEEMGSSLSPGAQNLMDMVQFQQKNRAGALGGFLPLLMGGGAFPVPAAGANLDDGAAGSQPPDEPAPAESGAASASSSSTSSSSVSADNTASRAQLAEVMARFLKGEGGRASGSRPELLPVLQSVCGQVTQLRLDDAAAAREEEEEELRNGSWELDPVMERRLEEMERRLREHVDRRLDALEQKLERALLGAPGRGGAGGGAPVGPAERPAPTPT